MPSSEERPWLQRTSLFTAAITMAAAVLTAVGGPAAAATAPGAPGADAYWNEPTVQGFADALSSSSKVWYTVGNGELQNVFYPQTDTPDTFGLQYYVTDGSSFTDNEVANTSHAISLTDPTSLEWRQTNIATNGKYKITKTYIADPARSVVLVQTTFDNLSSTPLSLYAQYNPALGNDGMGNTGTTDTVSGDLTATNGSVSSALAASTGFTRTSSGYAGTSSDGASELTTSHTLTTDGQTADTAGHISQTAQIPVAAGGSTTFTLALAFDSSAAAAVSDASASLSSGFSSAESSFQSGWHSWMSGLNAAPSSVTGDSKLKAQYNVSLMEVKADEDKNYAGGFIAAPTVPWGASVSADSAGQHGYHLVWTRDEYQMATALLAAGDKADANDALSYILNYEETSSGYVKQNSWLNGNQVWGGTQMDEVAFPIILAYQLGRKDSATWSKLQLLANYLVSNGPKTGEERWEENGGYSPSTMAAEVAGLVCAANIANANGDTTDANTYLSTADSFEAAIDTDTFTTTGSIAGGSYYVRITPNGNPNNGDTVNISNGGGTYDERAIVDQGFLELTRLGIKAPASPQITKSLAAVDSAIKTTIPGYGTYWGRYNHDGYGETTTGGDYTGAGIGRPWPVLSGERGEYDVQNGDATDAQSMLTSMANAANAGYQISEQIWPTASADGFTQGQPDNSSTPLMWAMAQYVRLAIDISAGKTVDTPDIVAQRYADVTQVQTTFDVNATTYYGQNVYVVGSIPALGDWNTNQAVPLSAATYPIWSDTVAIPANTSFQYKYIKKNPDGSITWESDPNNSYTTPASGSVTINDTWR
ncbi:glycoside hydrolase family 15 protein [Streptomyces sp. RB6PN25]|uniref:alpha-amylase n=1 Tax=Streptomyces humicola TaxID=2953240 RepID=A0ABT1PTC8_9ACTN|nr:glycoside hydrolase family 15 protein [Streptomyces humicola]MCQ4079805.1 glycoside hydrolase family 15 protein [Streptomyces humicola]